MSTAARRQPTGAQGEDFYTLREYVEGDDLRRIHWPATAKRGRYMIRQEETPWHARATILLDDRAEAYTPRAWEQAVESAASLTDLYHRSGYTFRLVGASDPGVTSAKGTDHFHRCLDLLAAVDVRDDRNLAGHDPLQTRLAELERQSHVEGVLVVVTGELTPEAAGAITRCARRFKMVITLIHRSTKPYARTGADGEQAGGDAVALLQRSGVRTLVLSPGDSLAASWSAMWRTSGLGAARSHAEGGETVWDRKQELA